MASKKFNKGFKSNYLDIRTIYEGDEVENLSEDSDVELEYQPSKKKQKGNKEFDDEFQFASSKEEYNKDVWNDLAKYVKRKAKTKTEDKIKKARLQITDDVNDNIPDKQDIEMELSDDELKHDDIKIKETKRKKKQVDEEFFEEGETVSDVVSFYEMNLSRPIMKAITQMKFVHPTPIQASTIPVALLGRDICGCAATGTGKTAAYMLPILERLLYKPSGNSTTRVLVLAPTRELSVQIYQVSKQLSQYTEISIALAVGGLDLKAQELALRDNPDIVIATPGRLIDHLKSTNVFSLNTIEVLVLDEADRMLDEHFAEQMKEIIKQCARTRQTMLFSATMTDAVNDLAAVSLNKPVKIFVDSNLEVAFNLRQEFVRIRNGKEGDREAILAALVCRTFKNRSIIFVQTKIQAHRLHILLGLCGLKVVELHGNLTQPQRLQALDQFKKEEADLLIATDVAARGLDIEGVQTVINFVMPASIEHYIHRVGRTARAGRAGISISLAGELERKMVKGVIKRATKPVKSRLIPNDIIEKYKAKLNALEEKVQAILHEEYEERMLSKTEKQANKLQNKLKGEDKERPWFQTKKQRMEEKERLNIIPKNETKNAKGKGKKQKHQKTSNEDRMSKEIQKVVLLQARIAKRNARSKKIRNSTLQYDDKQKKSKKRNKNNHFTTQLTDTSKKGAKKLRHQSKSIRKTLIKGVKINKKTAGKAYGKPQQKKRRN